MGHKSGKRPVAVKYRHGPPITYERIALHAEANCTALLGDSAIAVKAAQVVCRQFKMIAGEIRRVDRSADAARDQIRREFSSAERAEIAVIDRGINTACYQLRKSRDDLRRQAGLPVASSEPRMYRR